MVNDFSRIGFAAGSDGDLKKLHSDNVRFLMKRIETKRGTAEVLCTGGAPELWFYGGSGEKIRPELCEPYLSFGQEHSVGTRGLYLCTESVCPVLELNYGVGESGLTLHMLLLDHLSGAVRPGEDCIARPALFAQTLRICEDRDDFAAKRPSMPDCPSVVTCSETLWGGRRDPLAVMTGFAAASELRVNPLSGLAYAVLTLDCFGFRFPIAADPAQLDGGLPKAGSVVSGMFRICGTASGKETK